MDRTVLHVTSELVEFGALALMAILVAITICVGILFSNWRAEGGAVAWAKDDMPPGSCFDAAEA